MLVVPIFPHEATKPLIARGTAETGTKRKEIVHGVSGGLGTLVGAEYLEGVIIRGSGLRLDSIDFSGETPPGDLVVIRALRRYLDEFRQARRLQQYESLTGIDLEM